MLKNENKNMLNFLELEFMLRNIHLMIGTITSTQ